jgi:O-antigen ligase
VAGLTNTWANMLAEFGVLGLSVFALALGRLAWPVWQRHPRPGVERLAQTLFFAMVAVVLWQGFFTPCTNWGEPALAYPMMVVAAFCHRVGMARRAGSAA